ncbi:MAG: T9SS type B sorting domain-containing protein [Flavobacterium sp.]|nr:MAG: T9SS type B sorting domain-containing protein [Flavobacterium sp.]
MKKIILLLLTFLASYSGFAQLTVQTEGFEGSTLPDLVTDQWVLSTGTWGVFDNGVGTGQSWTVNNGVATPPLVHSGTNAAYMNRENIGMGNTSQDFLASPAVTIPANGQLRFWTRSTITADQFTHYKVMVSTGTTQNNPAAYTLVQEWTENTLTSVFNVYEEKTVSLAAYAGQTVFVAFVMEFTQPSASLGGDRWLVDDVRIVQQCLDPSNLAAGSISQTSAQLNWANPSGATQWELQLIPAADTPTGTGVIINSNPYTATATTGSGTTPPGPLQPSTQYQYYVRAICAGGIPSEWVGPFNFTTSSPGLTCSSPIIIANTPYSTTDNTSNYSDSTDVSQPAACAGTATNYMTGNEVFYSYTPTTSGAISITMTPNANWSGIFVYAGCANVGVTCVAGVANTGNSPRIIPSMPVTAGQQYIIVISTNAAPQTVGYSLVIQTLNCAPPTGLSAQGTGPNSANLSWDAGAATSWEVFVQNAGSPIPSGSGLTTTDNTNFEVTTTNAGAQLVLGTPYEYWVRADCGDGTFSPWTGPYAFNTTSCASGCNYNFIMTDTFGDGWNGNTMSVIQNGLTIATIGGTFTNGQGPITVSVPLCDGPFQLFWNAGGAFANEVGVQIVNSFGQVINTKAPGTGAPNSLVYDGIVDCANPTCLPPTNLTVTNVTTFTAQLQWTPNGPAPASWDIYVVPSTSPPPVAGSTPTANTTSNPFTVTGLLPDTTYTYYVRAVCSAPGANPWSAPSPNFTTLPTCPKPTNLAVSNITQTTASLNWTPGSSETAWQVIALPAGSPAPTAATTGWIPAPTNPFVITGLTSGTAYDYYVMAICTPTDSSTVAGPKAFNTTICDPAGQCLYTFTMTDSFGDGWNGNTMNVVQNGITVATIGSTFTTGSGPITVQVPLCNGIPFSLFWTNTGNFATEVGVSITSFLGEVLYTHAPGTNQQGTTLYTNMAMCIPPTCPQPTNLTIVGTGTDSATVSWTEAGTATQWLIVVQPDTAGPPAPGSGVLVTGTPTYTTPGSLAPGFYEFYVQAVCSDTDSSFWSGPKEFFISAQSVVCASVDIDLQTNTDGTVDLCPADNCVELSATYTDSGDTTNYNVLPIPFAPPFPFTGGTQVSVNTDDIWSPVITLPFNFCFFGTNYTSIQVGSNGVLTFNPEPSPGYCPWPFTQTIPNTTFPIRNAIYGVYQDINPATSTAPLIHNINYQILGTAPCRTFVVNYYQNAQFSCGTSVGLQTSQIVLYETSNIIDVYVKDRTSCTSWNSGSGLIGIQNAAGTQAHFPPGRNTGTWEAHNEAWRFNPAGASNVSFAWLMDGVFYSSEPTINVCIDDTTTMTAQAIYTGCGGTTTTTTDTVILQLNEVDVPPIEDVSVCDSYTLPALTVGNYYTQPGGQGTMLPAGTVIDATQMLYVYATQGTQNICSDEESFTVTVGSLQLDNPGDQNVCGSYTLPTMTVGEYYTAAGGPTGGGTVIPANTVIDQTQTIYIYGQNDSGTCTGEASFVVTVNQAPDLGTFEGGGVLIPDLTVLTSDQTVWVYAANGTCVSEASFTVTLGSLDVTAPEDVTACDTYTLEPLAIGDYYSSPGGVGLLPITTPITQSQTIYVWAQSGTGPGSCTDEDSFVVTINHTPVLAPVQDVVSCGCYTLPALAAGNYYTGPGATGTMLQPGDCITANQTIYVYGETGTTPNCVAPELSFTVTINQMPVLDAVQNVSACDTYSLAALTTGTYYTAQGGPNGGGVPITGDITSTQTVWVYAANGTGPDACVAEQSFVVTIGTTPQVEIQGGCQGSAYVLDAVALNGTFNPDTATYSWSAAAPGEILGSASSQSVTVSGAAVYTLTVTSGDCTSSVVSFTADNTTCTIQKGISPNGDGYNEFFDLVGQDVKKLEIFNRYGMIVYSKSNYSNQWVGQSDSGQELPDGTYYYVINRGSGETKTGWIYINRETN